MFEIAILQIRQPRIQKSEKNGNAGGEESISNSAKHVKFAHTSSARERGGQWGVASA